MQRSLVVRLALMTVISGCGLSRLPAQEPTPQAYSLTEDPGIPIMGPEVVKISRDGSKEVVDQTMPVIPGRDKEYHGHLIYDFTAHTLYTIVLSDPGQPCGVQNYNDPAAPMEFDVISGAANMMKELNGPANHARQAGTETLNGMPTKVMEFTSDQANGKVWLTQRGGYPVKVVMIGKDGKAVTWLEVKNLSFAKPPASTFALPASCASAQIPQPPAKPGPNVTALTLEKIGNYTGACPAHIKMVGTIAVDGPGTVFYQFGAGNMEPGETIAFSAAGTKTVTHVMTFQPKYGNQVGGSAILEAIGEDAAGNHGIPTQGSNNSDFNITCTSGGGQ
ncbi:MAG TPA: hypothetical protein VG028_13605 [Terriglobia bacterium]|nr:hypothetical protein [Terriglobia bacterium]